MFPTFPSANVFNELSRGTSIFDVPLTALMFPNLRLIDAGRLCFGLAKFQFPPCSLVFDAIFSDADTHGSDPKNTITHA